LGALLWLAFTIQLRAEIDVYLLEVPDYENFAGSMGTACGNLMGFWDRSGLPNCYAGPTAGGVAPLNSGANNFGIRALWTSRAGLDGRALTNYGHLDDYWIAPPPTANSYESTALDPYATNNFAHQPHNWPEHTADCIGDFIGLSQRKWTNMNNECDGNIDGFAFTYWDATGDRRVNFLPGPNAGTPARDVQSGLRAWAQSRGYDADVFSQLADFNPNVPAGHGFTFNDLKAEIDAGYPLLLFLQSPTQFSRSLPSMPRANPLMFGMLAYGYYVGDDGTKMVHYRTSAADDVLGENLILHEWNATDWNLGLPVRGVIGFHPKPKITNITRTDGTVTLSWDGPRSQRYNTVSATTTLLHRYAIDRAPSLDQPFHEIIPPTSDHAATIPNCCGPSSFFQVRLVPP
jgi:hypothetical protein